jgi:CHAT domain-containing protein
VTLAARIVRGIAAALWLLAIGGAAWCQDENIEVASEEESGPRMSAVDAQKVLAETIAPGASPAEQIEYFRRRERAAFAAGRGDARIAALRKLVELSPTDTARGIWNGFLWREMWRSGNQAEALAFGEKLVEDPALATPQRASFLAQLGNDYAVLGEVSKAKTCLTRAEAEEKKVKDPSHFLRISIEHLRGGILRAEGDYAGAEAANKKALALAYEDVAAWRGKPNESVRYDRAIRVRNDQMQRSIALALAQGKSEEAEVTARLGISLAGQEKTGGSTAAYWHAHLARAKLGQRRYAEARESATKAVELLLASGSAPTSERVVIAQLFLLQSLFGLEQWAEADQLARKMWEASADDAVARRMIDSAPLQALLHLRNGRTAEAFQRIDGSTRYRQLNYGAMNPGTLESRAVRAMVYQAQGQARLALDDYRALFAAIFAPETSFNDAEPQGLRGHYLPQAMRSYLDLVATAYKEGGGKLEDADLAAESFRVADRLRASVVQRALIDSASRATAAAPEIAATMRKEQDQRSKIRELFGELNRTLEDERRRQEEFKERPKDGKDKATLAREAAAERARVRQRSAEIRGQREALAAAQEARAALLHEVAQRFPDYAALVNPKPALPADVAKLLRSDEALVSIYSASTGTFVWAIAAGGTVSFHYAPLSRAELAKLVAKMRATLDGGEKLSSGAPPAFDAASSARIYLELVAPVSGAIASAKTIIFAVNGDLAQVPLATLVTGNEAETPWLIRRAAVAQVSSVAAFQALRQSKERTRAPSPFAGFGDPPTPYAPLPPLPETRREILAIAKALGANPERDTFFGARATREAVLRENLASRRIVAFSTHGLKPGDLPGLSRPALALAGPEKPKESPLLLLDDVMTLKLNADWVVLSACNTASEDGRAEEALSGLARGFFFAGARAVLVTHWAVESLSAEDLVTRTFGHLAKDSSITRAEALRRAQLEMADGKSRPAFRHPFFWAPYALSGDPAQ